jgi:Na+/H+ antiporter NhaC
MSKTNLHDTISLQLSPHKTTSRLPGEIMEGWWYVFPPLIVFIIVFVLYGRSKMKKIKEKDDSYRDKS